jgi:hypothetical protein
MADSPITEEWRVAENYPDYDVSNFGRVRRNTATYWKNPKNGVQHICVPAGALLSPFPDHEGYLIVNLVREKRTFHRRLSIIVCTAFNGPRPTPKHQAAHDDGVKTNNRADNLFWKTAKENKADQTRHGTIARGERSGGARLTDEQAANIKARLAAGETQWDIAHFHGVGQSTISRIKLSKTWRHIQVPL